MPDSATHQPPEFEAALEALRAASPRAELRISEIPAPAGLARRLAVAPRTPCLVVDSLMALDGTPAMILTSYVADPAAMAGIADLLRPGHWPGRSCFGPPPAARPVR